MESINNAFLKYIELNPERLEKCFNLISEDDVWYSPNKSVNSIGNLVLHLCGNVTQYINSGLDKATDHRNRDQEFAAKQSHNKAELLNIFKDTIEKSCSIIEKLENEDLQKLYYIQGFELTGYDVLVHVTEHLSYHIGQITQITKMITDKQVGYYEGLDLNKKGE